MKDFFDVDYVNDLPNLPDRYVGDPIIFKTDFVNTLANEVFNTVYIGNEESLFESDFGSEYILPIASASRLGGIKVGEHLQIAENGTLSVTTANEISENDTELVLANMVYNYINNINFVTDYNDLQNKPSIEGVTLIGNKNFSDLNLLILTNNEIDDLLY